MIKNKINGPRKILFSASGKDVIFTNNNLTDHILPIQEYIWLFPRNIWIFSVHEKLGQTCFFPRGIKGEQRGWGKIVESNCRVDCGKV